MVFKFLIIWKPVSDVFRLLSNRSILRFCVLDKEETQMSHQGKLKIKTLKFYMVLETIVYLYISQ